MEDWFVYKKCCRIWPLIPGVRVGPCGLCGEVPEEPSDEDSYLLEVAARAGV